MRTFHLIMFIVVLACGSTRAFGYCSEPSLTAIAPTAPYRRITKPYCMQEYAITGKSTCEQYEIDSYVNDVNRLIRELNDYIRDANSFADQANRFSKDAYDYAKCRSDEAKQD